MLKYVLMLVLVAAGSTVSANECGSNCCTLRGRSVTVAREVVSVPVTVTRRVVCATRNLGCRTVCRVRNMVR